MGATAWPSGLLPCPIGVCLPSATSLGRDAVSGILGGLASAIGDATNWLVSQVLGLVMATTSPQIVSEWFSQEVGLMLRVGVVIVVPLLFAASIGPVLRQDLRRLGRVWFVGLPLAVLGGMAAPQFAAIGLSATDELCAMVAGPKYGVVGSQFASVMAHTGPSGAPPGVTIAVDALMILGSEMLWLELTVRSAAVLVAVFFMPVVLACVVWPVTAPMARRGVEILSALLLSKFVIVACLVVGSAAVSHAGGGSAGIAAVMSGGAVLLMAAFTPFVILRLAPIVEAAAVTHLEGLSRRPMQAVTAATSMVAGSTPVQAVLGLASSGSGDDSSLTRRSVAAQFIPEAQASFTPSSHPGTPVPEGPDRSARSGGTNG